MSRYKKSKDLIVENSNGGKIPLTKLNDENTKVYMKFNLTALNSILGLVCNCHRPYVSYKVISTVYTLFKRLDPSAFSTDDNLKYRYIMIYKLLKKMVEEDKCLLTKMGLDLYIDEHFRMDHFKPIVENIQYYSELDQRSCDAVYRVIQDRINFIHLVAYQQAVLSSYQKLIDNNFNSYSEINTELKGVLSGLLSNIKRADGLSAVNNSLSMNENLDELIADSIKRLRNESRIIKTGLKQFNRMLGGGFRGSTLNCLIAPPGIGKTYMLNKIMLDVKRFNKNIETINPNYKPTVLLLSMEDTIDQLMSRIISELLPHLNIKDADLSIERITELLKTDGGLNFEQDSINIEIRYFPNRGIDTSDIYTIIEELKDDNKEVIMVLVDYLKRIKPVEDATEEHQQLKNSSNELRDLAVAYNIPVITAMQFNRGGISAIYENVSKKKDNAVGSVNGAQVGGSIAIYENVDTFIAIMKETDYKDQNFMSFKLLKMRYKTDYNIQTFAQPYDEYNVSLMNDVMLPGDDMYAVPFVSQRGGELEDFKAKTMADRVLATNIEQTNTNIFNLQSNSLV